MPVFTCGGMRYQQSWQDDALDSIDPENQMNLEACIRRAVDGGMNHIETARGYGTSEIQLGCILPSLPREKIIVQTKIGPKNSAADFLEAFEISLSNLKLDYVDLLSIHGINNDALLEQTLTSGSLRVAQDLQRQGRVRHIGFSTHAPLRTILKAIATDTFSYVNLHWYYFDQINRPAVDAAAARDMGVFIISPNDKGGKLYTPPAKLTRLCTPFTPMGFNDLFCLSHPQVHTLSIGMSRPSDIDAHLQVLPFVERAAAHIMPVQQRLETEFERQLGGDWAAGWHRNLPDLDDTPSSIPVYQILRMYGMSKAFDMSDYGKMRYNLLGSGGHWFPGAKAGENVDWPAVEQKLAQHPLAKRIVHSLKEAHSLFNAGDHKRLASV